MGIPGMPAAMVNPTVAEEVDYWEVSFVNSVSSSANTITAMTGIASGDILVLLDHGGEFNATLSLSHVANGIILTNGTSFSHTSKNFGTAAVDRHLVVYQQCSGTSFTGMTIGGITANETGTSAIVGWARVPTGTSGTVAFTMSGTLSVSAMSMWRVVGAMNITLYWEEEDTVDTSNAYSTGATGDIQAGGVAIAGSFASVTTGAPPTCTWTAMLENCDFGGLSGAGTNCSCSAASNSTVGTTTRTATWSADPNVGNFHFNTFQVSAPDEAVPAGWTQISGIWPTGFFLPRVVSSYKIATGSEGGTSITGMLSTGGPRKKILLQFRGETPITGVTVSTPSEELGHGAPATQSIFATAPETAPVLGIAMWSASAAVTTRTTSITPTVEVQGPDTTMWAQAYVQYSDIVDYTVSMADYTSHNALNSFFFYNFIHT